MIPRLAQPPAWAGLFSRLICVALCLSACATPTPSAPPPTMAATAAAPTATPSATVTPPPAPTSPAPTAIPPRFTIALPTDPQTLDPANALDASALLITRHLYDGLTAYAPGSTQVAPALATNWETTDGITWTFTLRPDAQFSDGSPVDAAAARLNFERWWNAKPSGHYVFWTLMFGGFAGEAGPSGTPLSHLVSITNTDAHTLQLVLAAPNAALPNTLAMPSFAIVNPRAFNQLNTRSAGSGPFVLADSPAPDVIRLTRNPRYWGAPPLADELQFKIIPDATQRLLALKSGEVEVVAAPPANVYGNVQADPQLRLVFDPPLNALYLGFNQARAPWNILACRQAVAAAVDVARYVRAYFPGDAAVAGSVIPPEVWGAAPTTATLAFDPSAAHRYWQTCVTTAGITPAITAPLALTLYIPPLARDYAPDPNALGQALAADLSRTLTLSVQIAAPEWNTWRQEVQSGNADLFLLGWSGVNGDPDSFWCGPLCGADAAFNSDAEGHPLPPDAELAEILARARATLDPDVRRALYAQAQQRLATTLPLLPLAHRSHAWVFAAQVQGYVPSPIESVFTELSFSK